MQVVNDVNDAFLQINLIFSCLNLFKDKTKKGGHRN